MEAHPGGARPDAACDLPFLDAAALADGRDRLVTATAFRSGQTDGHAGLPEPLCTV